MSQEDATLRMLREAGPRGLHTFEMRAAFIGNPSERIARLERRGHSISVSEREQLNGGAFGVRYFLDFDAELPKPSGESLGGKAVRDADPCKGVAMPRPARDSSASAHGQRDGSLFDAAAFAERGDYRDAA